MGLDMTLSKKRYLSTFDDDDKVIIEALSKLNIFKGTSAPCTFVECEVMDWRKSNAIHKWFVDNVQDGLDDCGSHYVSCEQLENLRDLCNEVLDDPKKAEELLPTQSGFFFGQTDYDGYYLNDLKRTVDRIDKELALDDYTVDYCYSSSW